MIEVLQKFLIEKTHGVIRTRKEAVYIIIIVILVIILIASAIARSMV